IEIEFKNNNELFRFGIMTFDSSSRNSIYSYAHYPIYLEWDLKINSDLSDSLLTSINWTLETIKTIKKKLDAAGCIRIESGNPLIIGFQRSGLGMYSYQIYETVISDSLKSEYKKNFGWHFFNDTIAWKYDGGAID
ncbi:hypothetical protein ACFLSQ_10695, partial [Bacteroidota bacterium]